MAEDESSRNDLSPIVERLERVERALREHAERVHAIEQRLDVTPLHGDALANESRDPLPRPPVLTETRPLKPRRDVELLVGGSWFNWLGIIAVTFGVAFFLKYAFEKKWLGHGARVTLGAIAGLAILFLADRLRARGLRSYAYVLSGGGILILYLSVYAAKGYGFLEQPEAFLLMSLVTAGAVALSVRHDARPIAWLALVGGFLTPPLLSTGRDNEVALFTYIALLDAGVLALAYFKRWRALNVMSLFATILTVLAWSPAYRREKLGTTLFFLTLFFLLYTFIGVVQHLARHVRAHWPDALVVAANVTFYLARGYALLDDAGLKGSRVPFVLVVAGIYAALAYIALARGAELSPLAFAYAGASVGAVALAVAIQFEREWVTVSWALMGGALLVYGNSRRSKPPRVLGLGLLGLTTFKLFLYDLAALERLYRIVSFVVLGLILLAVSYLYQKRQRADAEEPPEVAL